MSDKFIWSGLFGLEKENIRINKEGQISKISHNKIFGENNPYIIRDFSESQIEIITSPHKTIQETYDELHNIGHVVLQTLDNELLWPQSNPPIIINEDYIKIANYETDDKKKYREYLSDKYGKKRSVISGIHFNLSFSETYLQELFKNQFDFNDFNSFKNDIYLKITKYFLKDKWLYTELFSASPVFHETYNERCIRKAQKSNTSDYSSNQLISLRNSECGYRNVETIHLNYDNINSYNQSVKDNIISEKIASESEIYNHARLKKDESGNISYLELRFIDNNPLFFNGVSLDDLKLIHLMFMYYSKLPNFNYDIILQEKSEYNNNIINYFEEDDILVSEEKKLLIKDGINLLNELLVFSSEITNLEYNYSNIIIQAQRRLTNSNESYYNIIKNEISKSSYVDFHLMKSNKYLNYVKDNPLLLKGFDELELSTKILIQSAIKLGYKYEILDYKENFISLTNLEGKTEYIKQATKTSLDNYSSVLVMENKEITKKILSINKINVPKGYAVTTIEEANNLFNLNLLPKKLVIKPNNTNFGLGITIFKEGYEYSEYISSIKYAFKYDTTILLEEFIEGLEYRFLVIDDKVEGVLHRRAANVVGNGKNTIEQLIDLKNKHPYRGVNYQKPLECIEIDDGVLKTLKSNNLTIDSIPERNKIVYLRENSNISTGGDSIDLTELVDKSYFDKVLDATRALNVNISGVDVLIKDINQKASFDNFAIIELNFNPAIHIHCYPLEGKKRNIGDKIINALFNKNNEISHG